MMVVLPRLADRMAPPRVAVFPEMVLRSSDSSPWLRMAPPSYSPTELPSATPPVRVVSTSSSVPLTATLKIRKVSTAPVSRSMVPFWMVSVWPLSVIEGRPLSPMLVLSIAVRVNVLPPRSMTSSSPLPLAVLMAAIRSATSLGEKLAACAWLASNRPARVPAGGVARRAICIANDTWLRSADAFELAGYWRAVCARGRLNLERSRMEQRSLLEICRVLAATRSQSDSTHNAPPVRRGFDYGSCQKSN